MVQLSIKGHPTRGQEVIQLLEMLGGNNANNCYGKYCDRVYYINENGYIVQDFTPHIEQDTKFIIFSLEEFLEKFPYKVGDKVKNAKINDFIGKIINARWDNNEEQIIYTVEWDDVTKSTLTYYTRGLQPYKESKCLQELKEYLDNATPEQLEEDWKALKKFSEVGPVVDEYVKQCKKDNKATGSRIDFSLTERIELDLGDTHEVVVENGKTYVVKKKPTYPKYYTECEDSGLSSNPVIVALAQGVCMGAFAKLIVIRNAYWEIAGKQLGLDKPWEPDYTNLIDLKYCIINNGLHIEVFNSYTPTNKILIFPIEEMRDAFYENFKELIEQCKELL